MAVNIAPPDTTTMITGEALLAMGDIGPVELIDGRIVHMSPTGGVHGRVELRLARRLDEFVEQRRLGFVLVGETGIYTRRNPDRVRGMDIAFVSNTRAQAMPTGFLSVAPELIVEIVSPSDAWVEIQEKIDEYFSLGVDFVWIVDPKNRQVLVHRGANEVVRLSGSDMLRGEGILDGFALPLPLLFAE